MQKYRLEYAGIAKSWTFDLYNGQRVTLSKDRRIYVLNSNLTADAVRYYKSLAPQVKLLRSGTADSAPPKPQKISAPSTELNTAEARAALPAEIVEEVRIVQKNDPDAETESVYVVGDKKNAEELTEVGQNSRDSFSEADLCEYLDLNKTEEEIRELAQKLGVNVKRLRTKDSVITRAVREKFKEICDELNL